MKQMITFNSTKRVDSKAMPGVSFVFRVMTAGVRDRINLDLSEELARSRMLRAELDVLDLPKNEDGEIDGKAVDPVTEAKVLNLMDESERIRVHGIDPAYFRACFVRVENLTITDAEGKEIASPSALQMIEFGPEDLYLEMIRHIRGAADLGAAERENLESPTTSAAAVDGQMSDSTAASASATE